MGAFIMLQIAGSAHISSMCLAYIGVDDILGLARIRVKAEHKCYGIAALISDLPDDIKHIVKAIYVSAFMSMAPPFYGV